MKTIEIIGFKRANLGKKEARALRAETNVPCILYGGKEQVAFHTPAFLLRDLVYTPNVHKVELTIEGKKVDCIMQDIQFHPVNEMILHVDFLQLEADKPAKIEIPVKFMGASPGVLQGGRLAQKLFKIKVKALPKDLPDFIEVDISDLQLGKSVRVSDIKTKNVAILNNPALPIATVEVTRALKAEPGAADAKGAPAKGAAPAKAAEAKAAPAAKAAPKK